MASVKTYIGKGVVDIGVGYTMVYFRSGIFVKLSGTADPRILAGLAEEIASVDTIDVPYDINDDVPTVTF